MDDREQFLLSRKKGIGGSDSAAVVGLSPFCSPLQLYLDKTNEGIEKNVTEQQREIFERGNILEPFLKMIFERDYGFKIQKAEQKQHEKYPYILANVDGLIEEDNAIVEFKTRSSFSKSSFGEELTDDIPIYYLLQCHHYLLVHNKREKVYVVTLDCNNDTLKLLTQLVKKFGANPNIFEDVELKLKLHIVKKDEAHEKLAKLLYEKYDIFWNKHVLKKIAPSYASYEDVKALFPKSIEKEVVATEEIEAALEVLKQKAQEIELLENEMEKQKTLVCSYLGDSSYLIRKDGKKIATWKNVCRKNFDLSKFQKTYNSISLEDFYKTSTSRMFKICG